MSKDAFLPELEASGRIELLVACRWLGVATVMEIVQQFEGDELVVAEIPEDDGYHLVILSWKRFQGMLAFGRRLIQTSKTVYQC